MPNVKLNYLYRDYANYKNHGEAIFRNPDNLSLEEIEKALRAKCMDEEYFLAGRWGLKDLHFENYDDENDHQWHELQVVEFTDEEPTEQSNMKAFLHKVVESEWW